MTIWLILIVVSVPAVMAFANFLQKHIEHGEARFDENGKLIEDE